MKKIFKRLSLVLLSVAFANAQESRREVRNWGVDGGIGAPFYSVFAVQGSYLPVKYLKTYAAMGTGFFTQAYSVGADYLANPDSPVTFTAGLELAYAET